MTTSLVVVSAALVVLVIVLLWRLVARDVTFVQQQLGEVRGRLDALVRVQQDVPRAVAEEGAIQARSLAQVREQLVALAESARRMEYVPAENVYYEGLIRDERFDDDGVGVYREVGPGES